MQNDVSKFVVNIVPLQNVQTNVTGVSATAVLSNQLANVQKMVNYDQKRIYANILSEYTTGNGIQVISPMNLCNVSLTRNGGTLSGGTSSTAGSFSTLQVSGAVTIGGVCSAQSFVTLSDFRAKRDIVEVGEETRNAVQELRPCSFFYEKNTTKEYGFIAQEVETSLPECVHTDKDGKKYVKYDGILTVLVGLVKDLAERVEVLEKKLR